MQDVELLGQVLNRTVESPHVLEEGGHDAHRQRALQHVQSAVPEDERHGDGGQQLDDRPEQRVVGDRAQVRLQVVGVDLLELAELGALAAEKLHHAHPGDPLLQERVDTGEPDANVAIGAANVLAKPVGGEPNGRQHQERDERQLPAHEQHHAYNKDQGEDVPEHGHDARGEQLVQHLDVARQPGHQPADGVAVEEAEAETLELGEDLGAQVVHDPLADPGGQQGLRVAQHQGEDDRPGVDCGQKGNQAQVAVGDRLVDRHLGQVGPDEFEPGGGDQHDHGDGHPQPVGPQVAQQARHQPGVVRLAERFFLVEVQVRGNLHGFLS